MRRTLRTAVLLLGAVLSAGCGGAPSPADAGGDALPEGALPFDYCRGHLYFEARLCDTIPARLIFDSGAAGLHVDSSWLSRSGWSPRRLGRANLEGAGRQRREVPLVLDTLSFAVDTLRLESRMTPVHDLKAILGTDYGKSKQYPARQCNNKTNIKSFFTARRFGPFTNAY